MAQLVFPCFSPVVWHVKKCPPPSTRLQHLAVVKTLVLCWTSSTIPSWPERILKHRHFGIRNSSNLSIRSTPIVVELYHFGIWKLHESPHNNDTFQPTIVTPWLRIAMACSTVSITVLATKATWGYPSHKGIDNKLTGWQSNNRYIVAIQYNRWCTVVIFAGNHSCHKGIWQKKWMFPAK